MLAFYGFEITVLRGQIKYVSTDSNVKEETLKAIRKIQEMCSANQEIGVMIGPNGEHIKVIDEMGDILTDNDLNSLLCIYYMKHKKTSTINIPVTATRKLDHIAEDYSGKIKRISSKTRSPESSEEIFSNEELGRYPFLETDYDPMLTFLIIMEFAAIENTTLYKLRQEIPSTNIKTLTIQCNIDEKAAIMHELSDSKEENIEMIDGIRIIRDDAWILVLPDATQPLIHLYAEGDTIESRDEILKQYSVKIKKSKGMNI